MNFFTQTEISTIQSKLYSQIYENTLNNASGLWILDRIESVLTEIYSFELINQILLLITNKLLDNNNYYIKSNEKIIKNIIIINYLIKYLYNIREFNQIDLLLQNYLSLSDETAALQPLTHTLAPPHPSDQWQPSQLAVLTDELELDEETGLSPSKYTDMDKSKSISKYSHPKSISQTDLKSVANSQSISEIYSLFYPKSIVLLESHLTEALYESIVKWYINNYYMKTFFILNLSEQINLFYKKSNNFINYLLLLQNLIQTKITNSQTIGSLKTKRKSKTMLDLNSTDKLSDTQTSVKLSTSDKLTDKQINELKIELINYKLIELHYLLFALISLKWNKNNEIYELFQLIINQNEFINQFDYKQPDSTHTDTQTDKQSINSANIYNKKLIQITNNLSIILRKSSVIIINTTNFQQNYTKYLHLIEKILILLKNLGININFHKLYEKFHSKYTSNNQNNHLNETNDTNFEEKQSNFIKIPFNLTKIEENNEFYGFSYQNSEFSDEKSTFSIENESINNEITEIQLQLLLLLSDLLFGIKEYLLCKLIYDYMLSFDCIHNSGSHTYIAMKSLVLNGICLLIIITSNDLKYELKAIKLQQTNELYFDILHNLDIGYGFGLSTVDNGSDALDSGSTELWRIWIVDDYLSLLQLLPNKSVSSV